MAGKDIIMATQDELRALHIIHKAIDKVITQKDASETIYLSERQIRRKVKRIREEGDKGIIHKSRGVSSNRTTPDKIRSKVLTLFKDKYPDFGPTLASEKLFERDKIKVNDETLRLWLIDVGNHQNGTKSNRGGSFGGRRWRLGSQIRDKGSPWQLILRIEDTQLFLTSIRPPFACNKTSV